MPVTILRVETPESVYVFKKLIYHDCSLGELAIDIEKESDRFAKEKLDKGEKVHPADLFWHLSEYLDQKHDKCPWQEISVNYLFPPNVARALGAKLSPERKVKVTRTDILTTE